MSTIWTAPTMWSGMIVSVSWVCGLWGRRLPVRAGDTPSIRKTPRYCPVFFSLCLRNRLGVWNLRSFHGFWSPWPRK